MKLKELPVFWKFRGGLGPPMPPLGVGAADNARRLKKEVMGRDVYGHNFFYRWIPDYRSLSNLILEVN